MPNVRETLESRITSFDQGRTGEYLNLEDRTLRLGLRLGLGHLRLAPRLRFWFDLGHNFRLGLRHDFRLGLGLRPYFKGRFRFHFWLWFHFHIRLWFQLWLRLHLRL